MQRKRSISQTTKPTMSLHRSSRDDRHVETVICSVAVDDYDNSDIQSVAMTTRLIFGAAEFARPWQILYYRHAVFTIGAFSVKLA